MTNKAVIHSTAAPQAIGPYSQAVKVSNTVYLSGQIPLDPHSTNLVEGNIDVQTRQVFRNLAAVAEAAGGELSDFVKLTVYLVDLSDFASVNAVWKKPLSSPTPPGSASRRPRCPKAHGSKSTPSCALKILEPSGRAIKTVSPQTLAERQVQSLRGVGPRVAARLANLSIESVQDLLFHLPLRYQDRTRLSPLGTLQAGQEVLVEGSLRGN